MQEEVTYDSEASDSEVWDRMDNHDDIRSLVGFAVDYARDKVDGIIVRGAVRRNSQIRFSSNSIDVAKRWEELNIEMFIITDGAKTAHVELSATTTDQVKEMVDDTIEFLRRMPESMFFAGVEERILDHKTPKDVRDPKIEDFAEIAPEIVNAAVDAALEEGAKRVAGALKFGSEWYYQLSSYGPEGETESTAYDFNVRAFQEELDYSGQGLSAGTVPSRAESEMVKAGAKAGRLSKQAIGAVQGEPGVYDLVLSPTVAANVLGFVPQSANPFLVLIGMSPLADRMGQQIGPEGVTVWDDPLFPGGLASRGFDFEGTPSKRTTIVENGVLRSFIHNTSTARMYETESTGSSNLLSIGQGLKLLLPTPSNIVFSNGDHTLDELLESDRRTIYVTSNWYTRYQNYQTGDFSTIPRDVTLLIERGEMRPIKNIRISDNVMRMFANIDAVGNDRVQVYWWEVETPTFVPSMRVRDCRITAATQ